MSVKDIIKLSPPDSLDYSNLDELGRDFSVPYLYMGRVTTILASETIAYVSLCDLNYPSGPEFDNPSELEFRADSDEELIEAITDEEFAKTMIAGAIFANEVMREKNGRTKETI